MHLITIMSEPNSSLGEKEHGSMKGSGVKSVLRLSSRRVGELSERFDIEASRRKAGEDLDIQRRNLSELGHRNREGEEEELTRRTTWVCSGSEIRTRSR